MLMSHFKRSHSAIALIGAFALLLTLLPNFAGVSKAQTRHVYLEEFTGAWCGYCPRGAYAITNLYQTYPGQVVVVSIHNDQGNPVNDMMDVPQGDSMVSDLGFPPAEALTGFPDGWTARTVQGASWNVDPSQWATGVATQFGVSATDGIVSTLLAQPAQASVTVDNVSYNLATGMVTARVTATFASAMAGDLRLNLMVTEDSVTGTGSGWDQHNYYSATGGAGASLPSNPMYNFPPSIPGFEHMHVFREAVAGIHGQSGIIPSSAAAGTPYTATFTFHLPTSVENPNHVHLIGIVHEYSATDANGNEVLDAQEVPLTTTPIAFAPNNILVSADNGPYAWAHAGGDTTVPLSVENDGNSSATVSLSIDAATPLPAGWAVTFSPSPTTIPSGGSVPVTMTITAPQQSNYIAPNVVVQPTADGVYIPSGSFSFGALSDNTWYAGYDYAGETAAQLGMPDTMRLHTAYLPLTADVLNNYDPSDPASPVQLAMFLNDPILDGGDANYGIPSAIPIILNAMASGKRVYISSNDAMAFAFVGPTYTQTSDAQSFFNDSLGITWGSDVSRINSSNQYVQFPIAGTSDPIATGMTGLLANTTGSLAGDPETPIFTIPAGSAATSLFYVDSKKTSNVSLKAQLTSGNKVVYMGFALDALSNQVKADTIFRRSIQWLMSAPVTSSITSNPPSVDFGIVPAGTSKSMTVTLTNSGTGPATINTITVSPSGTNFTFSGIVLPVTLAAGGTRDAFSDIRASVGRRSDSLAHPRGSGGKGPGNSVNGHNCLELCIERECASRLAYGVAKSVPQRDRSILRCRSGRA